MKFLQVLPNPYRTLDADGNPIHAFPCSVKHVGNQPAYVGAKHKLVPAAGMASITGVDAKGTPGSQNTVVAFRINTGPKERVKVTYEFSFEPVDVPHEEHYRRGLRSGDILPANARTAAAAGMAFKDPKEILAASKEAAAKQFKREFGITPTWANNEPAKAPN